jgi:hypothetical protein
MTMPIISIDMIENFPQTAVAAHSAGWGIAVGGPVFSAPLLMPSR